MVIDTSVLAAIAFNASEAAALRERIAERPRQAHLRRDRPRGCHGDRNSTWGGRRRRSRPLALQGRSRNRPSYSRTCRSCAARLAALWQGTSSGQPQLRRLLFLCSCGAFGRTAPLQGQRFFANRHRGRREDEFMVARSGPPKAPADVSATTQSGKRSQSGKPCLIDDVWLCAVEGIPGSERRVMSAHGDLYINGLPK